MVTMNRKIKMVHLERRHINENKYKEVPDRYVLRAHCKQASAVCRAFNAV